MNTNQLKYLLGIFVIAILLSGCEDDEEFFTGADSFITSFSLEKDGTTYNASFYSDSIIVTAPDGVSLNGAKISYSISENANIIPSPDSISNWNEELLFSVTSYNGDRQTYKYVVNRKGIDVGGSVFLATQDEVDAFGQRGITSIKGNLVIGRAAGTDSITSLAALYQLKEIGYNLIINSVYKAREFTGLDALEKVGGEININEIGTIKNVDFQNLSSVGSVYIKSDSINSVEFPKLTEAGSDLYIDCPLNILKLNNLQKAGGKITIMHSYNRGNISALSFPLLTEVGSFYFARFQELSKIELPELTNSGELYCYFLPALDIIYLPKLKETTGSIKMYSTLVLSEVSLPVLEKAAGLDIPENVSNLEVPKLTEISDDLFLRGLINENLDFLSSLTSVGGTFTIYNLPNLTAFEAPPALKSVGKLSVFYQRMLPPDEINIRGMELNELEIKGAALIDTKLIGEEEFDGILNINCDGQIPSGYTISFPELEGFSTIDSLRLGYVKIDNFNMKGVRKIRRGFQLPSNSIKEFQLPDLEEVGGDFVIATLGSSTKETIELPQLKTVAGNFDVKLFSGVVKTLSFSALESVEGDFSLTTGYGYDFGGWGQQICLTSALFESLATINGKLTISSGSSSFTNNLMTNLDGFSALTNVNGIEVTGQGVLTSYEGLKNALPSFSAENWLATNNAYNPAYEELSSGQWIQP
nr:hypothetical protein [uncultured Draconibacterium sp.]